MGTTLLIVGLVEPGFNAQLSVEPTRLFEVPESRGGQQDLPQNDLLAGVYHQKGGLLRDRAALFLGDVAVQTYAEVFEEIWSHRNQHSAGALWGYICDPCPK